MININNHVKSMADLTQVPSGFSMTFANGNTISVQFGAGNYCANKLESNTCCANAEIAIWDKNNKDYTFADDWDQVKGYCSADDVAKWINFAANYEF